MEPEEVLAQLENWPSDDEEHEDTSSSGFSDDESDMLPSSEEGMVDNELAFCRLCAEIRFLSVRGLVNISLSDCSNVAFF